MGRGLWGKPAGLGAADPETSRHQQPHSDDAEENAFASAFASGEGGEACKGITVGHRRGCVVVLQPPNPAARISWRLHASAKHSFKR